MSERDYSKLTVNVLKEELKKRGLDQAGKKADLVSRLESDDLNNSMKVERIYSNEDTTDATEEANETSGHTSVDRTNEESKEDYIETTAEEMNEDKNSTDDSCTMDQPLKTENVSLTEDHSGDHDSSIQHPEESCVDNSSFPEGTKEVSDSKGHVFPQADSDSKEHILREQQGDGNTKTKCEDVDKVPEEPQSNNETCTNDKKEAVEEMDTKEPADPAIAEDAKKDSKPNAEDDVRIANEYCIEMKRDKDEFQLKWKGKKFSVPFIGEIVLDLAREISSRSFQVKQIELKDLKSSCFEDVVNESLKFLVDFQSNILDSSKMGYAKFVFKSVEECEKHKNALKGYNENMIIESVKFEDQLMHQFLNKDPSFYKGSIVDRLLYVGNLPFDVTQSTVGDLFPGALRLIFPPLKEIDQSVNTARYVYLEYESAEEVTKAAEKYKDVVLNDENLFVIKALCIKKERFGLLTDTLRMILLDKVRKLKKIQRTPYGKSRQELQEVEKGISLNMDKLSTDSKHRKGWGMELGALDEERIEKEELDKPDSNFQKMGGMRSGRGASRGSYDSRRPNSSNLGQHQRYGNVGSYNNYGSNTVRPGWSAGNYYGASGFANHGFMNQGYSQGYNAQHGSFYGNKRKASDNYGGDWKRGRPF